MTNGPSGPGELMKPQEVLAGTDRVADGFILRDAAES